MLRGLAHETEDGPEIAAAYTTTAAAPTGGNNGGVTATSVGAGTETAASVTSTSEGGPTAVSAVDSHLDSFFAQSALTREDVLVIAAVVQMVARAALLYLEVSES